MGIAELADNVIPSIVHDLSRTQMLDFYSPADFIFLATQTLLLKHATLFDNMIRAFKFTKDGKVMSPWKISYEPFNYNKKYLTQKQLYNLYLYYIDLRTNVQGSKTYIFSTVVTQMTRGWNLQAAKYF